MTFFRFFLSNAKNAIIHRTEFLHSDMYRGFALYFSYKKNSNNKWQCSEAKKNIVNVILDIRKLYYYWNAFPDSYFRLGMFMKGYGSFEKMKSFVPQGAYARLSVDKDPKYNILIDDKILFHDVMSFYGLPVPTRYFIFRNNEFRHGSDIIDDSIVDDIIKEITDERVFIKKYTGGAAKGVSILTKIKDGVYVDSNGDILSAAFIRKKYHGQSYIFEQQIIQEPVLKQFNPDTVNTIRILTFEHKIIAATVRFGGKGEYVDNVSANGVAVSVDVKTGKLGSYGLKMYSTIERFYEHPDSHIQFDGVVVPRWSDIVSIVEKTLRYLPYYKSVGFDIATTDNGPVILEINTGAGINLSQMGKEIGLEKEFAKF